MQEMEWGAPFAGSRAAGYSEGVCAADVADDGVVVGEHDGVAG